MTKLEGVNVSNLPDGESAEYETVPMPFPHGEGRFSTAFCFVFRSFFLLFGGSYGMM